MMVLHRDTGRVEHRAVADLVEYLDEKDLLVINDTKVFPARLIGVWEDSPGAVEVLMVSPLASGAEEGLAAKLDAPAAEDALVWSVMVGSGRPCREGQTAVFGPGRELKVVLRKRLDGGLWRADFVCARPLMQLLDEFGRTPVPPYVHREGTAAEEAAKPAGEEIKDQPAEEKKEQEPAEANEKAAEDAAPQAAAQANEAKTNDTNVDDAKQDDAKPEEEK